MKKIIAVLLLAAVFGCGSSRQASAARPLYEILAQQPDGGATIRFYEILTEPREIIMLKNDETLKNKIQDEDLKTASFIILNMGEKTSGGYSITVDQITETADKIIVTVKEKEPAAGTMSTTEMTYPYTIVKINSKKPIEIK